MDWIKVPPPATTNLQVVKIPEPGNLHHAIGSQARPREDLSPGEGRSPACEAQVIPEIPPRHRAACIPFGLGARVALELRLAAVAAALCDDVLEAAGWLAGWKGRWWPS